jgi:glycosyltransferase involved in cell wall biosynthesis
MNKEKIAVVVSSPLTVKVFLKHQIEALAEIYNVTVIANMALFKIDLDLPSSVKVIHIPIAREIKVFSDITALYKLIHLFLKEKYTLIHSVTPKAGFLAMLAARVSGVEHRLHTFTGQVWVTKQGVVRWGLRQLDKWIATSATTILVDSPSQKNFIVSNHVVSVEKSVVLADGSISGVDAVRFQPNSCIRFEVRNELGLTSDAVVLLFVGRLKKDKGVIDLAIAFSIVCSKHKNIILLVVGPDEEKLQPQMEEILKENLKQVRFISYTKSPENYMMASDIFCLPSYREGFGSVVIEAASCGLPAIGSRIYGVFDAIVDDETGILIEPGNVAEISRAITKLAVEVDYRLRLANASRRRALKYFPQQRLTDALLNLYKKCLNK